MNTPEKPNESIKTPESLNDNLQSVNIEKIENIFPNIEKADLEKQSTKLNRILLEEFEKKWLDFKRAFNENINNPIWNFS